MYILTVNDIVVGRDGCAVSLHDVPDTRYEVLNILPVVEGLSLSRKPPHLCRGGEEGGGGMLHYILLYDYIYLCTRYNPEITKKG